MLSRCVMISPMKPDGIIKPQLWAAIDIVSPYLRRYAGRIAAGCLALIVVDFIQLCIPRVIKRAVDDLQNGVATSAGLLRYAVLIVLLALVIGALRYVWRHFLFGFSRLLEMHLRNQIFAHALSLDREFYHRNTTGEIMALATNDLAAVQMAGGMGLVALVDAVVMGLAAIAFMAYIQPLLTLIAISPLPLLAFLTRFLSARLHHRFKKVQEQFSHLTEFARATIASIRLVKAYNQEEAQSERFNALGETYVQNNLKVAVVHGTLYPLAGLISNVSLLLAIYFGGRLTIQTTITAGDFVAFISYLFLLTWPMMALGWVANLFQRGFTSLERIKNMLSEVPTLRDTDDAGLSPAVGGQIRIRNLTFTYPQQRVPALQGIDLDIHPGVMGVVGRTGAGKTTLCHLLTRLYPVPDGAIWFDDRDVNSLPIAWIRGAIAYVPQDVTIFSDTIAFNISLGKPDAAQGDIERVAQAAAIHEEILAMPDGYATRVGERGIKLSGGQRQRLAIARALLLDRPIIIIDDGLSGVDMETEHAIIKSIAEYLQGRTCIIVSHRVAPLADAQVLVVMDRGRVVAQGNHDQLLQENDFYRTIYRQQSALQRG
jgi:ATP-binding cassette subfamily B multidrug efflux pump